MRNGYCVHFIRGMKRWLALLLSFGLFFAPMLPAQAQLGTISPEQLLQLQQRAVGQQNAVPQPEPNVTLQPELQQPRPQLPQSRLEQIMSARAAAPLRQFGYEQFGVGRAITVPQTGAVQDDYVLGVGDEVVISLRGQENNESRIAIDRNGQVLMQRLSPIPAAGRTVRSVRQDIEAAVSRAYVATNVFVSVARVRQISVLVSGEVNNPGQRLLTGLSSVVDALLLSGGVRKTGSLRNVRIQRGGREYTVDLYSVLTARGNASPMRLADGDRILVPLLGPTVTISGLVRQPGIMELAPRQSGISVASLLQLAGGQEVRGLYRLSVLRIEADGRTNLVRVNEQGVVQDSEILFVQMGADQVVNRATLTGDMALAGAYPIVPGTLLSEFLRAPGALGVRPYTLFGVIVRRDRQSLMRTLVPFTPVAVVNGRENIQFESEDSVKIFSVDEVRLIDHVVRIYLQRLAEVDAATRDPLAQNVVVTTTNQAGPHSRQLSALQTYITNVPPEMQRQTIISLLDEFSPESTVAALRREENARLERERQRTQLRQPVAPPAVPGVAQPAVALTPTPPPAGIVPESALNTVDDSPASNFIASGAQGERYAGNRDAQTFGQLVRQLDVDPLIFINFLVDQRARLEGAVRGPGDYLVGPSTSLQDLIQAAGGTVSWADESGVELITTVLDRQSGRSNTQRQTLPLRTGTLASYIVKPRDHLRLAQIYSNTGVGSVTIQGEVRNPGTFSILRGDRLSDVLARAGGLTNTAYAAGTVFLRQSVARLEHESYLRAAREVEDQLVLAMTRVGNARMDPSVFTSMQVFVQELKNQKPVGRVSIVADPSLLVSRPDLDPLLEADDVIFIPQRPSTISILGQVMQPGSYPFLPGESVSAYIERAGGYAPAADSSSTFVVLPDGSARRIEKSWFRFEAGTLPPGSTIVVPRDIAPLDLRQTIMDVTQILSQLAVSVASVAVISR